MHYSPLQSLKHFRLEMINEFLLLTLCYHLLCFTDLTDILIQIETVEPSFQAIVVLIILVNLVSLIYEAVCPRDSSCTSVEDNCFKRSLN